MISVWFRFGINSDLFFFVSSSDFGVIFQCLDSKLCSDDSEFSFGQLLEVGSVSDLVFVENCD